MKSYLNVPDSSADDSFLPPWVGFWVYVVYAAGVLGTISASDCCTMKMNSNGESSRRAIHYLADTAYITERECKQECDCENVWVYISKCG